MKRAESERTTQSDSQRISTLNLLNQSTGREEMQTHFKTLKQ